MKPDMYCKVGEEDKQVESQCVQVLDAVEGDVLEIALVNEGELHQCLRRSKGMVRNCVFPIVFEAVLPQKYST